MLDGSHDGSSDDQPRSNKINVSSFNTNVSTKGHQSTQTSLYRGPYVVIIMTSNILLRTLIRIGRLEKALICALQKYQMSRSKTEKVAQLHHKQRLSHENCHQDQRKPDMKGTLV